MFQFSNLIQIISIVEKLKESDDIPHDLPELIEVENYSNYDLNSVVTPVDVSQLSALLKRTKYDVA